jgi:hypothetical protein
VDKALASYSHDPALAANNLGDIFIIGHGHAHNASCTSSLDMCVSRQNSDGSWASPSLIMAHTPLGHFDSSPSVKWSVVGFNRPETIEFVVPFIMGNYANSTLYYGSIVSSAVPPVPTPTPVVKPTLPPAIDTPPAPTATPGPALDLSLTARVGSALDDFNEDPIDYITQSRVLWLGTGSTNLAGYTGLRFTDLEIPPKATITSARLRVYSIQDSWIDISMKLAAEASGDSAPFSLTNPPSQRFLTASQLTHFSSSLWQSKGWYYLDEMAPVVQEIIDRSDWQSGNSLSIILKGTGTAWGRKFIQAFEDDPDLAVQLVITYH